MTKLQAINLIADRLGNRHSMDGRIVMELDASQEFLEQGPFRPWFLVQAGTVVTSSQVNPLPPGFLGPVEDTEFLVDQESGEFLLPLYEWQVGRELRAEGRPRFYVLGPTSFALYPAPKGPVTLSQIYYATQPLVSGLPGEGSNGWLRHAALVLVNHAGSKVAAHLRAPELAQLFESSYLEAYQQLLRADAAWRAGGKAYRMGG